VRPNEPVGQEVKAQEGVRHVDGRAGQIDFGQDDRELDPSILRAFPSAGERGKSRRRHRRYGRLTQSRFRIPGVEDGAFDRPGCVRGREAVAPGGRTHAPTIQIGAVKARSRSRKRGQPVANLERLDR
jgi:hypothetical protein